MTAQDAVLVINRVLLAGPFLVNPYASSPYAFDVNADGTANLNDAQVVLDELLGLQNYEAKVLDAIPVLTSTSSHLDGARLT